MCRLRLFPNQQRFFLTFYVFGSHFAWFRNLLPFENQRKPANQLTVFGDLWRNQLWQCWEEGCLKPMSVVWIDPCLRPGVLLAQERLGYNHNRVSATFSDVSVFVGVVTVSLLSCHSQLTQLSQSAYSVVAVSLFSRRSQPTQSSQSAYSVVTASLLSCHSQPTQLSQSAYSVVAVYVTGYN